MCNGSSLKQAQLAISGFSDSDYLQLKTADRVVLDEYWASTEYWHRWTAVSALIESGPERRKPSIAGLRGSLKGKIHNGLKGQRLDYYSKMVTCQGVPFCTGGG